MKIIYPYCPHKVYYREEIPYSLPLTFFDTRISLTEAPENTTWQRIKADKQTGKTPLGSISETGTYTVAVPCQVVLTSVEEAVNFVRFCFSRTFSPFAIDALGNSLDLSGWTEVFPQKKEDIFLLFSPYDSMIELLLTRVASKEGVAQMLLNATMRRLLATRKENQFSVAIDSLIEEIKVSAYFQIIEVLKLYPVLQVFSCHADSFHYILEAMERDKGLWISVKEPMLIWLDYLKTLTVYSDSKNRFIIQEIKDKIESLSNDQGECE